MIDWRNLAILGQKEFSDRLRSRWVFIVAVVFTLFATVIAYFGSAGQGAIGFRAIDATIASLVSLVIYLIPLIALVLGFDAVVGERERGSLDLLLSMPITRFEIIFGKYLGLAGAMTTAIVVGFGIVGLLLWPHMNTTALFNYVGFVLSSVLLGLAFLSFAILISVMAKDRASSSGLSILVWFLFVLIFDLLMLGLLVATGGEYGGALIPYLLLLNPTDVFRLLNIFHMNDVQTMFGLGSIFPEYLASPWLLGSVMVFWILAPLFVAVRRFRK